MSRPEEPSPPPRRSVRSALDDSRCSQVSPASGYQDGLIKPFLPWAGQGSNLRPWD